MGESTFSHGTFTHVFSTLGFPRTSFQRTFCRLNPKIKQPAALVHLFGCPSMTQALPIIESSFHHPSQCRIPAVFPLVSQKKTSVATTLTPPPPPQINGQIKSGVPSSTTLGTWEPGNPALTPSKAPQWFPEILGAQTPYHHNFWARKSKKKYNKICVSFFSTQQLKALGSMSPDRLRGGPGQPTGKVPRRFRQGSTRVPQGSARAAGWCEH